MSARQLGFGLLGIVGIALAFVIGLRLRPPGHNANKRVITISALGPGKCDVDFPVTVLHYGKGHTVRWASTDNKYWISSISKESSSGSGPNNPLVPPDDTVVVDPTQGSSEYHVTSTTNYYMYAIFDHDPTTNNQNPCKSATDDRDTGLNVKP